MTLVKFESEDTGINFGKEDRSTNRDLKIELHEDQKAADADPNVTYSDDALIEAWKRGDEEAKVVAAALKMKPAAAATWWDCPWEDEEAHIAQMKQDGDGGDNPRPPPPVQPPEDGEDTEDEDTDDEGGGGGGGGGGGVGGQAARELSQALVSLAARTLREKTDPLVEVPADRGGGKIYKRTLVDEFNKDLNMSLDASRLGRIRLSTHQLSSLEQLQASQREKAAAAAGGGAAEGSESSSGGSGGGGAGAATPPATAAAADAPSSTEVSIGSDVAFAMDEGTGSSRQIKFWIGRVVKLFKGRATWRRPVPVDGDLPTDIFAVCEWYSEVKQSGGLRFRFRQVPDRAKYCFVNFIGVVRIDFDSDASSRFKEDRYTISQEQLSRLNESLKLTTPVRRGGTMTLAEQQQKEAQQKAEIESQAKPRINLLRPSNRVASRGNSYSAAASTTTSSSSSSSTTTTSTSSSSSSSSSLSSSSSSSRPTAASDDDDNEMGD